MAPWDAYWLQGGQVDVAKRAAPGLYEVSQLVIGTTLHLWVLADGADTGDRDEVFFVTASHDRKFGDEEREKFFRPRRARLRDCPSDLGLGPFEAPGRDYALVTIHRDATVEGAYETVSVDAGLLVTAITGEQLLFYADQEVPLDMYVTTSTMHIDQYLATAADVRPVCQPPEA